MFRGSTESTSPDAASRSCLVCRIGERMLAVPLAAVIETMRPLPVDVLLGTARGLRGVATIRGAVVPVIDVGLLIGVPDSHPTRFVTLALGDRTAALAVDAVLGLQTLDATTAHELPPLLASADLEMFSAIGILDAELLLVLDQTRLVPDAVWLALDGAGPAEQAAT